MTKNIEDLLYRGDSLERMGDMSSRLREDSRKYRKAAVRINWELLLRQVSPLKENTISAPFLADVRIVWPHRRYRLYHDSIYLVALFLSVHSNGVGMGFPSFQPVFVILVSSFKGAIFESRWIYYKAFSTSLCVASSLLSASRSSQATGRKDLRGPLNQRALPSQFAFAFRSLSRDPRCSLSLQSLLAFLFSLFLTRFFKLRVQPLLHVRMLLQYNSRRNPAVLLEQFSSRLSVFSDSRCEGGSAVAVLCGISFSQSLFASSLILDRKTLFLKIPV